MQTNTATIANNTAANNTSGWYTTATSGLVYWEDESHTAGCGTILTADKIRALYKELLEREMLQR